MVTNLISEYTGYQNFLCFITVSIMPCPVRLRVPSCVFRKPFYIVPNVVTRRLTVGQYLKYLTMPSCKNYRWSCAILYKQSDSQMRSDTQGQGQGLTKVKRLDNIDNKIIEELDRTASKHSPSINQGSSLHWKNKVYTS